MYVRINHKVKRLPRHDIRERLVRFTGEKLPCETGEDGRRFFRGYKFRFLVSLRVFTWNANVFTLQDLVENCTRRK